MIIIIIVIIIMIIIIIVVVFLAFSNALYLTEFWDTAIFWSKYMNNNNNVLFILRYVSYNIRIYSPAHYKV